MKNKEKNISKKLQNKNGNGKNSQKMEEIKIEKVVLSVAGTAEKLERGVKLLKMLSGMTPVKLKSKKRIPSLGVRPGLEVGCKVTLRKEKIQILKRLLQAVSNELKESQIVNNHFSFGIHEYIEIPGTDYQRDIGVLGLNVTVDFVKPGKRIERKKIMMGKIPSRQEVKKEQIIEHMKKNFELKFKEKD